MQDIVVLTTRREIVQGTSIDRVMADALSETSVPSDR